MIFPTDVLSVEAWTLLAATLLLLRYYIHRRWHRLVEWNIPHDPATIFNLGHARNMISSKSFAYELECKRKYGAIWGYYLFATPRIVIHDPEILRQILIKEFSNFSDRLPSPIKLDGKEMASGLLTAKADQWKRIRLTISPAFSTSKLKQMVKIVEFCLDSTIAALDKRLREADGIFSAKDTFSRLSLDVICSAAFSTNVNSQDTAVDSTILKHARGIIRGRFNPIDMLSMAFPFLHPILRGKGERQRSMAYFKSLCQKMIDKRSLSPDQNGKVDLLQLMIQTKVPDSQITSDCRKGMTITEITGNAMTMLLAGYETTGTAMTCLAFNLAHHVSVQEKLQTEIDKLYASTENPNLDDVNSLKYLEMCVNENLRLYSPVPKTARTAKNEITVHGLTIPSGCTIHIPIYAMCHDPEFWRDPMEFDPERMRNISDIDFLVFQPFGSGPRNCIGSKFALMETKLAFCRLLRRYSIRPATNTPKPPLQLRFGVASKPKDEFDLRIIPREKTGSAECS